MALRRKPSSLDPIAKPGDGRIARWLNVTHKRSSPSPADGIPRITNIEIVQHEIREHRVVTGSGDGDP
jgi:hypothetical protein